MDSQTLLIIFVGLTGVAVLLQACVLLALYFTVRKATEAIHKRIDELKANYFPLISTTKDLIERVAPQIVTISTGIADLTELLQSESQSVRVSVSEIMERVNRQSERLDALVTTGLDTIEHAGNALEHAVAQPVRRANGIVAGVKAAIASYRSSFGSRHVVYPDPDAGLDADEVILR
jgi:hypothetical protein